MCVCSKALYLGIAGISLPRAVDNQSRLFGQKSLSFSLSPATNIRTELLRIK